MSILQKIGFSVVVFAMVNLLLIIVFSDNGLMELNRLKNTRAIIDSKNAKLVLENRNLSRIIDRLKHDPAYIEAIARKELHMIGKDEVVIKLPNRN
ncbi:MAG: septum formation initiator family protein [Desulfobacteraceae bacterium]|nr:septum formation initiator family protein [Desulfobacteraceae bacterium]